MNKFIFTLFFNYSLFCIFFGTYQVSAMINCDTSNIEFADSSKIYVEMDSQNGKNYISFKRENIIEDNFVEVDLSELFKREKFYFSMNLEIPKNFLIFLNKKFENKDCDRLEFLCELQDEKLNLILNRESFKKECNELFQKVLTKEHEFFKSLKKRMVSNSGFFCILMNFLFIIKECESLSPLCIAALVPAINLPLGIYIDRKINNFLNKELKKDTEKFEREKKALEDIFKD